MTSKLGVAGALAAAQRALDECEWDTALALLDELAGDEMVAEVLELRALALYGSGRFEASVASWEELHRCFVGRGDPAEAARAAATVALYLMMDSGLMSAVRGWVGRAERLLVDHDEAPAHALIALVRTYERLMSGDLEATAEQASLAIELGERMGVTPAVVIGRVAASRVLIFRGAVEEGVAGLDEVSVLLMSGEVDPLTSGMMYCELVCAAQGLGLHDRAREWTLMMDGWRPGRARGGLSGRCRVHRAEMLRMSGPCDAAEAEAVAACEELRPWMRREFGWPLVELGNIRLRKGDLDGAEEAFLEAHRHVWTPHPGLALLRLEQGDVDAAVALIADAIAHPLDVPSKERPPFGDLRMAPLHDAQVQIAAEAGDAATAAAGAKSLRAIATRYASAGLTASATVAEARAALLAGDTDRAIESGSAAVVRWGQLDAPFEAAMARMVLAAAHQSAGNLDSALVEWEAARAAFAEFGAVRWEQRAADAAAQAGTGREPPQSARPAGRAIEAPETAMFRRNGDSRVVVFRGHESVIRDLKGFRHLERLIGDPGREFHALDLATNAELGAEAEPGGGLGSGDDGLEVGGFDGLLVLDDEAREAYRRRLTEVDDDIDEAERMNDPIRAERARHDREYLVAELARGVGLGGRGRLDGDRSERARMAVTRSIRYSLRRLAEHQPELADHLAHSIRTGTYCAYEPDPMSGLRWEL